MVDQNAHYFLTLDGSDSNTVLELVRSDTNGMYIRDNGQWQQINPDDDNSRIWGCQIQDMSSDAADIFDQLQLSGQPITADQFSSAKLNDQEEL